MKPLFETPKGNIIMNTNRMPINEIVANINEALGSSIKSWKEVAKLLYIAREQYYSEGKDNSDYQAILNQTGIHIKTAIKLAIVGKALEAGNPRLKAPMLATVQSWTVLYDALTMTDDQFRELEDKMKAAKAKERRSAPTRETIKRIKNGPAKTDDYVAVFSIRVDANAIRSGRFSDAAYAEMLELMEKVQALAFARVDETKSYQNRNEAWVSQYQEQITKITQKQHADSIKALSKVIPDFDCTEWVELAKVDPDGFYDQVRQSAPNIEMLTASEIAEEARRIVDEKNAKLFVNEPYSYANTAISNISQ